MNTSEVLNRAADLIEERGWTKGDGWNLGGDCEGPYCAEGAILAVRTIFPDRRRAIDALSAYLHDIVPWLINPYEGRVLPWVWNDRSGVDAEQVIETLRAAAVIEAAKETSTTAEATRAFADRQTSPQARAALLALADAQAVS